jgi:hypothetical protein
MSTPLYWESAPRVATIIDGDDPFLVPVTVTKADGFDDSHYTLVDDVGRYESTVGGQSVGDVIVGERYLAYFERRYCNEGDLVARIEVPTRYDRDVVGEDVTRYSRVRGEEP